MREWSEMSLAERRIARYQGGVVSAQMRADDCLRETLGLLAGDAAATEVAWKTAWGNYLVNTPYEIAEYCKAQAARDAGENAEEAVAGMDAEGICPACGELVDHEDKIQMDGGGVYPWTCPRCGATGEEGFSEVFDGHHYNVRDKDGKPIQRTVH